MLLTGVSIITWCLAILDTVTGPGLGGEGLPLPKRLGAACGFGCA